MNNLNELLRDADPDALPKINGLPDAGLSRRSAYSRDRRRPWRGPAAHGLHGDDRLGDRQRRDLGQAEVLLQREDPSRILLFGGGFRREGLIQLCRAELRACGGGAG